MITLNAYWMGRDRQYRNQWTGEIQINGTKTVERINRVLAIFKDFTGIDLDTVASGWRPAAVNAATANAAKGSKHLTAQACDIHDTPQRDFARWCLAHQEKLEQLELYMENPQWTPTWVHLQIVPPGSGHRVFIPSTEAPLCAALPEQVGAA